MKFSIVIPAYKAKYLKEAIDSILVQTYQDFEIVIVNDASPEDLDSIVNTYYDQRIHYFKNKKNCGVLRVVDNWNICLDKVKGDFVICMGDDDKLKPECLAEYNKLMEKYPGLDVYHGWTVLIDEYSRVIDIQEPRPEFEGVFSAIWGRFHGRKQFIGDYLFRTSTLKAEGGFYYVPMAWGSDDITAFRAMLSKGVANTQQPVFQYRVSSITLSNSSYSEMKMQGIMILGNWERNLIKYKPQILNEVEMIFYKILKRDFEQLFQKIKESNLRSDFREGSRFRKFQFWWHNKNRYKLTFSVLFFSLVKSLKN